MEGLPERLGPWQRQPGANGKKRRGGLSTEEQGYVAAWQDASARLDAACETAEALGQRVQEQDAIIEAKDGEIKHLRGLLEQAHLKANRKDMELRKLKRRDSERELVERLRSQLTLLTEEELAEIDPSNLSVGYTYGYHNSKGIFELRFAMSGHCILKVTPERSCPFNQPFKLTTDNDGLSAGNVRELTGALGLSGRLVPNKAEQGLFADRQQPPAVYEMTAFMLADSSIDKMFTDLDAESWRRRVDDEPYQG